MRAGVAAAVASMLAACSASGPADVPAATDVRDEAVVSTIAPAVTIETAPSTSAPRVVREPSTGVGDRLFPELGSADVDVITYDLRLTVPEGAGPVDATISITADVDIDVDVLALDATGLDISAVRVDGAVTTFDVADPKLLVDLPAGRGRR